MDLIFGDDVFVGHDTLIFGAVGSMLPGYTHSILNLSETEDLVTVMYCNEVFNPEKPDTALQSYEKGNGFYPVKMVEQNFDFLSKMEGRR